MATLKHINSKNADYGAAEQYLLFEHDEFTMKPVLDETGRLIPREDYRLSTLNCDGEDFAVACMRANLRYQKNQRREDVKSHHYIISFDPRDGPDNGLTVDRAQALGEQFCKEHFPGHQALVCTHPDGHNHSGNIHVHIVINSLRIEEVPFLPYMDRPADTKVGCKHRCTDAALRYFKSEVMEMCHREGLYQIDLLNGSKNRVTDREYWAQKKGQAALDKQNAPMIADSIIMLAPIFSGEYEGVDNIILTSKYGKTKCATAKVVAGIITAILTTTLIAAFNLLLAFVFYGTEGLDCSILFAPSDYVEAFIPFNITCGTLLKYQILLAFTCTLSVTGITLFLSAISKNQIVALVAAMAIFLFPVLLPITEVNPLFRLVGLLPIYHVLAISLLSVEQMSNGMLYAIWAIPAALLFLGVGAGISRRVFAKHQVL